MEAGELLARIHGLTADGGVRHDLRLPRPAAMARAVDTVEREMGASGVAVVERGPGLLATVMGERPARAHVLVHGDFLPKNLVVRDGRVVGVIDWEFAGSAPPAFDLARWEVSAGDPWHEWSTCCAPGTHEWRTPTSRPPG